MNALRLFAAAFTAGALLLAAAIGCSDGVFDISFCNVPTLDEKGMDGGPDPCHCDPLPSQNISTCLCLSDPTNQGGIDDFQACMALLSLETDAGGKGGP
jgi:hypothetical protein